MSGFKPAKVRQAAIKLCLFGESGSGKTFTALLAAEGLVKGTGKKIAYLDTENGTAWYGLAIKERAVHPEAFTFNALYTQSITETLAAVKSLDPNEYGVVVIDSISHLWASCIAAYEGKQTRAGSIPLFAWGRIKQPYNSLINILMSSPLHVIVCGRQKNEYETDAATEELRAVGVTIRAEGSTKYEFHVLVHMEAVRQKASGGPVTIVATPVKDRTSILSGRSFVNPSFESLIAPLMGVLGGEQARIATADETAIIDAEALDLAERLKETTSRDLCEKFQARLMLAANRAEIEAIGKELTPAVKAAMIPSDVAVLREAYLARIEGGAK